MKFRHAALSWLVLLVGCTRGTAFVGECQSNAECPVGATCRIGANSTTGLCICRSDEACGPGEVCNSQGICQKRTGCFSNADCEASKFCNLGSGECIDRATCGSDVHCLPGTTCEGSRCVDGCHSTGDCPLYTVCEGGSATAIGRCVSGKCGDKSFCDFGSNCIQGSCVRDNNHDHCSLDCQNSDQCGGGGSNFCLINSSYDPSNPASNYETFCAVECENQEQCPNGYNCGSVVLLTQDQCTNDDECGGGGRRCFIGEGDLRGFCSCVDNEDCAFDSIPGQCAGSCGGLGLTPCSNNDECPIIGCLFTCQGSPGQSCTDDSECQSVDLCQGGICLTNGASCNRGTDCLCVDSGSGSRECVNTGRPCTAGTDCNPPCVNNGCLLGSACAPEEGLLCTDIR